MRKSTGVRVALWAISIAAPSIATNLSAQEVLPKPEAPFHGKIGRTAKDSVPDFPKGLEAPPGRSERPPDPHR